MAQEHLILGIYWLNHKITADQYINLVYNYFIKLKQFSLDFDQLKVVGAEAQILDIGYSLSEFEQVILPLLQQTDTWYKGASGEKSTQIQKDFYSEAGFYNEFVFEKDEELILISITAGNYAAHGETRIINNVLIEFPENDAKYQELPFVKELFQLTLQFWNPATGWVISKEFRRKVNNNASTFIGWLNYFNNRNVEDFIPEEIKKENFNDGLITVLSDQIPSADDPMAVSKAISLRDNLGKNNLLNWR